MAIQNAKDVTVSSEYLKLLAEEKWRKRCGNDTARKKSPGYYSWYNMKRRCSESIFQARSAAYFRKGITFQDSWKSFDNFIADMGERPAGMSLERIDNDKGYTKENCCWATDAEQRLNTSRARRITCCGVTYTLAQVMEFFGFSRTKASYMFTFSRLPCYAVGGAKCQ